MVLNSPDTAGSHRCPTDALRVPPQAPGPVEEGLAVQQGDKGTNLRPSEAQHLLKARKGVLATVPPASSHLGVWLLGIYSDREFMHLGAAGGLGA